MQRGEVSWRGYELMVGAGLTGETVGVEQHGPEVVLTFDPRHGTSCHPDHRETGRLVLEAVELLDSKPDLFFLETLVTYARPDGAPHFVTALAEALRFDATQLLASGDPAWTAVSWDMQRHSSQFPAAFVAAVENVPHDQRAVFIAPATAALEQTVAACR